MEHSGTNQGKRTSSSEVFGEVFEQSPVIRVPRGRRTGAPVWNLGPKTIRVSSFVVDEQSHVPATIEVVCEGSRIGRCHRCAEIVRRQLVASNRPGFATRRATRKVLSDLGLGNGDVSVGRLRI